MQGTDDSSSGTTNNNTVKQWIIGSVFLRQYYTIYDFTNFSPQVSQQIPMGTGMVGFAERATPLFEQVGGSSTIFTKSSYLTLLFTIIIVPILLL